MKSLDIVTAAMQEIGALAQGETPTADDANFVLSKLNLMLDSWNAQSIYIYTVGFQVFTLIVGHQPHTIGLAANAPDFNVTQNRPIEILNAAILLPAGSATPIDQPMNIRGDEWWAGQRVKTLQSSLPTDLYYSPDWPNGSIYLWPIPNMAYGIRLEMQVPLAEFPDLNVTTFTFPPGYRAAIVYSLAESLGPAFGKSVDAMLVSQATKARMAIQNVNSKPPYMSTQDLGIPKGQKTRPYFNYLTGSSTGR